MTKKHAKLPRKANLPLTLNMIILCHLMAKDILGSHYVPNWALTPFGFMNNKRGRPACASAQTDQRLCYLLLESTISKLATNEISIF